MSVAAQGGTRPADQDLQVRTTASEVFVHSHALCESTRIGPRTRVWAFAHILPGARVGSDCNICDNVFVENDVRRLPLWLRK